MKAQRRRALRGLQRPLRVAGRGSWGLARLALSAGWSLHRDRAPSSRQALMRQQQPQKPVKGEEEKQAGLSAMPWNCRAVTVLKARARARGALACATVNMLAVLCAATQSHSSSASTSLALESREGPGELPL
jgi:hypothetical protein